MRGQNLQCASPERLTGILVTSLRKWYWYKGVRSTKGMPSMWSVTTLKLAIHANTIERALLKHQGMYPLLCTSEYVPTVMYIRVCTHCYVHQGMYPLLCTSGYVPIVMYIRVCTHCCVHQGMYRLLCTSWYVPTVMYIKVCAHCYVHQDMYPLLCTSGYVPTVMYIRVCTHCYVHQGMCPLLCTSGYVPTVMYIRVCTHCYVHQGMCPLFSTSGYVPTVMYIRVCTHCYVHLLTRTLSHGLYFVLSEYCGYWIYCWDDSRFALCQWETALICNAVSHWLCAIIESAMYWVLNYYFEFM